MATRALSVFMNRPQLEFVIADSGNIPSLERKTLNLAFARTIWTYTTSKVIVSRSYLLSLTTARRANLCDLQGIYPTLIIILIDAQKSCLEESITSSALNSSLHFTKSSTNSRGLWSTWRKRTNEAHTIEINVHEMQDMDDGRGVETASTAGIDEIAKGSDDGPNVPASALNKPL